MSEPESTVDATPAAEPERKQRGFPSALAILAGVTVFVWILTFLIPAGEYARDAEGKPEPGSYSRVAPPLDTGQHIASLPLSPINGLYGIRGAESEEVGPYESGRLFGGADVFLFILAIGGMMAVVFETGAINRAINALAHSLRARGPLLIAGMITLFSLLGTVMTWGEESFGFFALLVPLVLALGYDRMVTVSILLIAPSVGVIGSTVTPFRIGVGSEAAGISIGDGIVLRVVLLVLCTAALILWTLRYAGRVKRDPATSLVGIDEEDAAVARSGAAAEVEPLTGQDKVVTTLLGLTFALLAFSVVPWGAILGGAGADSQTHVDPEPFRWELNWWMPELTALFLVMAVVFMIVGRLGEKRGTSAFLRGVLDFTGPAFLVLLARGVSVLLTNTKTIDTVLAGMETVVTGRTNIGFILLLSIVSLPLVFLVGAGSAGMALVMPILAPLGDFVGIDRSLILSTYNALGGWLTLWIPTSAVLMAGLTLAKVRWDQYMRFITPLLGILLVIILGTLMVGLAV